MMRRRTPKRDPPQPKPIPEPTPGEPEEIECRACGETFMCHPDDPPTCSQQCWRDYTSRE